jgi:hypothetical protein
MWKLRAFRLLASSAPLKNKGFNGGEGGFSSEFIGFVAILRARAHVISRSHWGESPESPDFTQERRP